MKAFDDVRDVQRWSGSGLVSGFGPAVALLRAPGGPQLTAALLDLAVRGHLTIWYHHLDTGRPRAGEDVLFELVPDAPGELTDAEAELLERVFSHGDMIAVDTLRRLSTRWPADLAARLSDRVPTAPEPTVRPRRRVGAGTLAKVFGAFALGAALLAGALIASGMLRGIFAVLAIGLPVVACGVVAERVSTRGRRRAARRSASIGPRLLQYRRELQIEVTAAGPLRCPADYDELLGSGHAWAIAMELVPDWLALSEPGLSHWDAATSGGQKTVWVRRAQPIPVVRNQVSLRIAHRIQPRIPAPRRPRD